MSARFLWVEDSAEPRNQFVRFERNFDLLEVPAEFPMHLFADTRYRLRVNGRFVAAGPGRFVTQFPEFDTHHLAEFLRPGKNSVSVEVNFFGASSFQSMPDGKPGFIAWGGGGSVDLATPGGWEAFRLHAWRWDAPLFSFAQSPVEICDTRFSEAGAPARIAVLDGDAAPWGDLLPYSGMPIPFFIHRPKRIELAGRLATSERRLGFMSHNPDAARRLSAKPWTAFATWIRSPKAQAVTCSCFWSELRCNGLPVAVDTSTPWGNHARCQLDLREGWNLLTGEVEVLSEFWAYCLGIPEGLSLHGRRDAACAEAFAISPNSRREDLRLPADGDSCAPDDWILHDGNPARLTPARMVGWDIPAEGAVRDIAPERLPEVSRIEDCEATWCFSFQGEFLGHAVLDVEGPEGATLDVAFDDWQAATGGVRLYASSPFTDAADRFILRGGRQTIELFHPRGGKLLQATLRSPAGVVPLALHDVFVRSRQALGQDKTRFSCDNPNLGWAWPVAMRTLIVSADEAYSDCPWRERGSYIGDCSVNILLNLLLDPDGRTARRTLRLFAQAQLPNGQLPCCAPSWLRSPHEDFTLVWLLAIHDLWANTGDTTLAEEVWPAVRRIWESPTWGHHPSGLWNADNLRLFIDWGAILEERSGKANAVINILRFGAAQACAALAEALGKSAEAAAFRDEAERVERAAASLLWDDARGCYRASLGAGTSALHANILALRFGLGTSASRERILAYVEPLLRENFARGTREGGGSGHIELYFFHYALPALAAHGRPDLAEILIDDHYGFLRGIGDDTLPECFYGADNATGSRCHSWSGAPAIYAARHVLGIRPAIPGNPSELIFDPVVHRIARASGRISHPAGWIEVSWHSANGKIVPCIKAPDGVEVRSSENMGNLPAWELQIRTNQL
ncbi:MAG: hypothetical protein WCS65_15995 [Verrucomicrobiae bacterium]